MEERVQKLIAASGRCSRRAAEELLRQGRVTVNGTVAGLGAKADPARDTVAIDGAALPGSEEKVTILLHKPRGYTCTLSDRHAAHPVTELLSGCKQRVYPVGRLDVDSEGLLLLTNDGALAHRLLHPGGGVAKRYIVTVSGLRPDSVDALRAMREIEGEPIRPAEVRLLSKGPPAVLEFVLREGKKRQIRRMCRRAGLGVRRLCRVAESGLTLGDLPAGRWRFLTEEELALLTEEAGS